MQLGSYLRLDFRRITGGGREVKIVKLVNPNENSVLVIVKSKKRDPESGKFTYTTEKTVELFQTNPAEVSAAVVAMVEKATGEKLPVAASAESAKTDTKAKK